MDVLLIPLLAALSLLIWLYTWVVIVGVVLSWLVHFHVVNQRNHFVLMTMEFTYRATEPVVQRIRRFMPSVSGLDFSPFVLIIFLWFLRAVIGQLMVKVGSV